MSYRSAAAYPWPVPMVGTNRSPSLEVEIGSSGVDVSSSDVSVTDEESLVADGSSSKRGVTDEESPVPDGSSSKRRSSEQTEGTNSSSRTAAPTYSYLVKIIPPNNKRRATVHEMYDVEERFQSPAALKAQISDSFGDKVKPAVNFQIGYFEGRGTAKRWISSVRDLSKMYFPVYA